MNRETWLEEALGLMRPLYKDVGLVIPPVKVSVGFPKANVRKVIGQCWYSHMAKDGIAQVFISPVIGDSYNALGVLAHELVHAVVDPVTGHGKVFKQAAKDIGLTLGKPTHAMPDVGLGVTLLKLAIEVLPEYPQSSLTLEALKDKTQTTRLLKVECGDCGYTCRVTRKWLDSTGAPLCPCNQQEMREG